MLASAFAFPVFAQNEGDFFGALQDHLPQSTSTINQVLPTPGMAETVITSSTPNVDVSSSYQAYNAGRDHVGGYIAGGAVVIAVLAIVFVLGFLLTHHHASEQDT
jgi:hypothetical protein